MSDNRIVGAAGAVSSAAPAQTAAQALRAEVLKVQNRGTRDARQVDGLDADSIKIEAGTSGNVVSARMSVSSPAFTKELVEADLGRIATRLGIPFQTINVTMLVPEMQKPRS